MGGRRAVAASASLLLHAALLLVALWAGRERPREPRIDEGVAVVWSAGPAAPDAVLPDPPAPDAPHAAMPLPSPPDVPDPPAPAPPVDGIAAPPAPEAPPAAPPSPPEALAQLPAIAPPSPPATPPPSLPSPPAPSAMTAPPSPATAPPTAPPPPPPAAPPSSPPAAAMPAPPAAAPAPRPTRPVALAEALPLPPPAPPPPPDASLRPDPAGAVRLGAGVDGPPGPSRGVGAPRDGCAEAVGYPDEARRAGLEGAVGLRLRLSDDGRVVAAVVERSSGSAVLDDGALRGIRRCRFEPALRDGRPVWANHRYRVVFRLG